MNICLKKTIAQIEYCLSDDGGVNMDQLRKMYDLTLRLQSQLLSVIYDTERGSARSVCLGRRDEQNRKRSGKRSCVGIDARPLSAPTFYHCVRAFTYLWCQVFCSISVSIIATSSLGRMSSAFAIFQRVSKFACLVPFSIIVK